MSVSYIESIGRRAKLAASWVAMLSTKQKNNALLHMADRLTEHISQILVANAKDLADARENGIAEVMVDRLMLNEDRVKGIADAIRHVVELDDPVGYIDNGYKQPSGLSIVKTRVPLGVVGIIYESRPNVTVDAAALCIKSGNVAVLRGGKEAINTNKALADIMRKALTEKDIPEDMVLFVEDTSREVSTQMMKLNGYLDVLIPRGGAGLIQAVVNHATVPVIETGVGNCHVYVDHSADLEMAVSIVNNAKTSRPSVCNACESLLVHKEIAQVFLPLIQAKMNEHNVVILGCEKTRRILGNGIALATEEDYATEFLDYKISVKVVEDVYEAIDHINRYSTKHSECIVTNDLADSERFTACVDAAAVYVNASTRFTDGGEFGLGAEIGISTQKLHARGPMGLKELTTIKYIVHGNGQIK